MPGTGVDSFIRIARETTAWGTAETVDFWTQTFVTEDLGLDRAIIPNNSITIGAAEPDPVLGGKFVRGSFNIVPTYTHMDWFLWGVMGTYTESTPAGGTLTRDHWSEIASTLPSFTMEVNRGDLEANDKVFIYTGCKVTSLELTFTSGNNLPTGVVTWVGKDETSVAGGSTASAPHASDAAHLAATYYVNSSSELITQDVGSDPDAGSYCVRQLVLRINRNLDTQRYCMGTTGQPNEPIVTSFAEVTGEMELEFKDRNVYEAFDAGTIQSTGNFLFQHGTIIEGALKRELQIKLNRFSYVFPSQPFITGPGQIFLTAAFRGHGNGGTAATTSPDSPSTYEPLAVRTRNTLVKANL